MGLFKKAGHEQHTEKPPQVDPEQPAIKSAASAPDSRGDVQQQRHTSDDQAHRASSEPVGLRQRHSAKPQKDTLTAEQRATLEHVQRLTKVMDSAVTIPVLGKKVGLDALIGLVPYAGDMAGATVGTYIITRALKFHLPKRLVVRMLANQAIDSVVGLVPFLGDIFDVTFKANTRNMKLLEEHLEHPKQAKRADTCFLFGLFFLVVVLPVVLMVAVIAAIILGILAATGRL